MIANNAEKLLRLCDFRLFSSTAIGRGIGIGQVGVEKPMFDFFQKRYGAPAKQKFGPRKPRCVDFSRQTYSNRYDFCDRFRSFSSTAIDRGIGIGRIGVEKTTFDFCTEMYGAPAKNCSGPENRDASILVGKHIANAMIFLPFSIVLIAVEKRRSISLRI